MKPRAMIVTNGCPENRLDCAETEQLFIGNGWEIASRIDQADVIVLNLCGLLDGMEAQSLSLIDAAKRKKKKRAAVVVTGCLPKINPRSIGPTDADRVIKGHDLRKMADWLGLADRADDASANYLIPHAGVPIGRLDALRRKLTFRNLRDKVMNGVDLHPLLHRSLFADYQRHFDRINLVQPDTFYIKVSSGCKHACAYCAVKRSRGAVKSKPVATIRSELLKGVEAGFRRFALIGTDLGSYGADIQTDLTALLRELVVIDEPFSLKLRNVHPQLMIDRLPELEAIVGTGKVTHITSAIQHGNDRVLRSMKRAYRIADCLHAVNTLKQASPHLAVRTQLIVGFPGESEAEFGDSLKLIEHCRADFFEIYPYSPRIGTLAAALPHRLPMQLVNRRRYIAIQKVLEAITADTAAAPVVDYARLPN